MTLHLIFLGATASLVSTLVASQTVVTFPVELRRGFNAATYATRDSEHPGEWIASFQRALHIGECNHSNSDAFLLGAQFGLSYRIAEFEHSDHTTLSPGQLRALVIQGTLARLKCEERKRALGATDACLVRVLHIPIESFVLWKSGVSTADNDTGVVDPCRWLQL